MPTHLRARVVKQTKHMEQKQDQDQEKKDQQGTQKLEQGQVSQKHGKETLNPVAPTHWLQQCKTHWNKFQLLTLAGITAIIVGLWLLSGMVAYLLRPIAPEPSFWSFEKTPGGIWTTTTTVLQKEEQWSFFPVPHITSITANDLDGVVRGRWTADRQRYVAVQSK